MRPGVRAALAAAVVTAVASATAALGEPGRLDKSFGRGSGFVTTAFGSGDLANLGDVVQTSHGLLAVGSVGWPFVRQGFGVARYRADGTLDPAFGTGGRAVMTIPGLADYVGVAPSNPQASSILGAASLPPGAGMTAREGRGGQITLAGVVWPDISAAFLPAEVVAARVTANGTLDRGYGRHGFALVPIAPVALGAAYTADLGVHVYADGSLLATLWSYTLPPCGFGVPCPPSVSYLTFVRLDRTGVLDRSFGVGGVMVEPTPEAYWYGSSAVLDDGSIVVAGATLTDGLVRRFHADGTPDTGFGTTGVVLLGGLSAAGSAATAVTPAPDAGVLVSTANETLLGSSERMAVIRLDRNGAAIHSFGHAGTADLPAAVGSVAAGAVLGRHLVLARNLLVRQQPVSDVVDLDVRTGAIEWSSGALPGMNSYADSVVISRQRAYVGGTIQFTTAPRYVVYALDRGRG